MAGAFIPQRVGAPLAAPAPLRRAVALFPLFLLLLAARCPGAAPYEKDGAIIMEGRARPASDSVTSEKNARVKADANAHNAFIAYCLSKNLPLPAETEELRGEIVAMITRAAPLQVALSGITTVKTSLVDGEVVCVLSVPKSNVALVMQNFHFDGLDKLIELAARTDKCLHYELCARTGRPATADILLSGEGVQLHLWEIVNRQHIEMLPGFWDMTPADTARVEKEHDTLETWSTEELLFLLDGSIGIPLIYQPACRALASRGYTHVADFFQKIKLPVAKVADPSEAGLSAIQKIANDEIASAQTEQKGLPILFTVLVENYGLLSIADSKGRNPQLDEAKNAFANPNTDWNLVERLALESFFKGFKNPTADAFNLLGRVMETARHSPALAAYCYAQAYAMDNQHPYAAANLALVFDKMGRKESSLYWMALARKNENLSAWGRAQLDMLEKRNGKK